MKVVTVKSIMHAYDNHDLYLDMADHERVNQDVPLNHLIRTATFNKDPIIVTDSNGKNIGYISQACLLRSVIEENTDG